MSYSAEISRRAPTAFVILVDQSASMGEPFGIDVTTTKAEFVADAVNRWIQNLVLRCAKGASVRDYFHLSVLGYGGDVFPLLASGDAGLVPVSSVASEPLRVEDRWRKVQDGAGGVVEVSAKFPVWIEPIAESDTPMAAALGVAHDVLSPWVAAERDSFPPVILNITDGQSTDADPRPAASSLTRLATTDGSVLLFNCHISAYAGRPILFPDSVDELPDPWAELLFEMTSEIPDVLRRAAIADGHQVTARSRGFAYQADAARLVSFLDIGTRLTPMLGAGA